MILHKIAVIIQTCLYLYTGINKGQIYLKSWSQCMHCQFVSVFTDVTLTDHTWVDSLMLFWPAVVAVGDICLVRTVLV